MNEDMLAGAIWGAFFAIFALCLYRIIMRLVYFYTESFSTNTYELIDKPLNKKELALFGFVTAIIGYVAIFLTGISLFNLPPWATLEIFVFTSLVAVSIQNAYKFCSQKTEKKEVSNYLSHGAISAAFFGGVTGLYARMNNISPLQDAIIMTTSIVVPILFSLFIMARVIRSKVSYQSNSIFSQGAWLINIFFYLCFFISIFFIIKLFANDSNSFIFSFLGTFIYGYYVTNIADRFSEYVPHSPLKVVNILFLVLLFIAPLALFPSQTPIIIWIGYYGLLAMFYSVYYQSLDRENDNLRIKHFTLWMKMQAASFSGAAIFAISYAIFFFSLAYDLFNNAQLLTSILVFIPGCVFLLKYLSMDVKKFSDQLWHQALQDGIIDKKKAKEFFGQGNRKLPTWLEESS